MFSTRNIHPRLILTKYPLQAYFQNSKNLLFFPKFYFRKSNLATLKMLIKKMELLYFICESELKIMVILAEGFRDTKHEVWEELGFHWCPSFPGWSSPRTAAHQAPLSLGFSRQEHWSMHILIFIHKSIFYIISYDNHYLFSN